MGAGHLRFTLWIWWGIATFAIVAVVGGLWFRRAGMEFDRLLNRQDADPRLIAAGQRRMAIQQLIMIALLLATVWAMVVKPAG